MQGELVQIISLTSYGNEYIHTGKIPDHYFPESTVFPFPFVCNIGPPMGGKVIKCSTHGQPKIQIGKDPKIQAASTAGTGLEID